MLNTRWVKEHAAFSSADYAGMLGSYGKPILAITGRLIFRQIIESWGFFVR